MIRGDATPVYRLAGDLSQVGFRTIPAVRTAMAAVGEAFAHEWASNAREHFHEGGHADRYPDSIDSELVFSVTNVAVEVGPNPSKATGGKSQAFLGKVLEFGNEDTPPYLDGLRALDGMQVRAERILDATVGHLFP